MATAQESRPAHFHNLWRVAGWIDEHQHAMKLCRPLGYEVDEDGADVVRVEFVDVSDLFVPTEALIHPHMLLPA